MRLNSDLLDAIIEVELQFKIQLAAIPHMPKSFVLMTNGKWDLNYLSGSAAYNTHTASKIVEVLIDEFKAGDRYVFWWIVKHIIKVFTVNRVLLLFNSDDIDQYIHYVGVVSIKKSFDFTVLLTRSLQLSNFRALEQLHSGDSVAEIKRLAHERLVWGNVDTCKWYQSQGVSWAMGIADIKFVARLDAARYLYSNNWFVRKRFTIDDLVFHCQSIVNREVALIEWLVDKMNIDVRHELRRRTTYVIDRVCGSKDITLMCWLIDNYADMLKNAPAEYILRKTVSIMGINYVSDVHNITDNPLISRPFEKFVYEIYPANKLIDVSSLSRLSMVLHANMLSFLIARKKAVGFDSYDGCMLATQNKVNELKYIHSVNPDTITVETFAAIVRHNDRDVITWVINCLNLKDNGDRPSKSCFTDSNGTLREHFCNRLVYHLDHMEDDKQAWWLYRHIGQTDTTNGIKYLATSTMRRAPECRFLDRMGLIKYDFMESISESKLQTLINNHLSNGEFAILQKMRNANPALFDKWINYDSLGFIGSKTWVAYDCGRKIPKPEKLINNNLEWRFSLHKIYADQNDIPFSVIYAKLSAIV